jgi:cytoskeletal protein CcmA (bactofilin family)
MAMFGRADVTSGGARSAGGNLSFIGHEVTITGNIGGSGNLHIDLGTDGYVRGNIVADSAQVSGSVEGTVAARSLVIEATARIVGDLSYDAVSVASGAQVEGRVKRLTRDAEPSLKLIASD